MCALQLAGHKFQGIAQQNLEDTRALTNWAKSICIRASLKDNPEVRCHPLSAALFDHPGVTLTNEQCDGCHSDSVGCDICQSYTALHGLILCHVWLRGLSLLAALQDRQVLSAESRSSCPSVVSLCMASGDQLHDTDIDTEIDTDDVHSM